MVSPGETTYCFPPVVIIACIRTSVLFGSRNTRGASEPLRVNYECTTGGPGFKAGEVSVGLWSRASNTATFRERRATIFQKWNFFTGPSYPPYAPMSLFLQGGHSHYVVDWVLSFAG